MAGAGAIAVGAVGAALLLITLIDIFVTIFNYDGFTFLAGRVHRITWRLLRLGCTVLPERLARGVLSLGSAAMLPMTLCWWLALEITAFALMYYPGLLGGAFVLDHLGAGIGAGFFMSGEAIATLNFPATPVNGLYRGLVDLQTALGFATFTLALTYVLTGFGALNVLNRLHARVRRHAVEPNRPSSILTRYYRGGSPEEISRLLAALIEDLDTYDQQLRRYPVVFYFHPRRPERSIPRIFAALGDVIELLRWGLPADEPLTDDPYVHALADEYAITVARLRQSFVGPGDGDTPDPVDADAFTAGFDEDEPGDEYVAAYRRLLRVASEASGLPVAEQGRYERYREWLPYYYRRREFLRRVRRVLGYPEPSAHAGQPLADTYIRY